VGDLLLPAHLVLTEDLGGDLEVLATLWQETSAEDDGVVTHDCNWVSQSCIGILLVLKLTGLVVVDVGGAVWAVVAVDVLAFEVLARDSIFEDLA